jgi:nucleotide-binding universal stress UspA family protein
MNLKPLLSIVDSGQVGTDPVNAAELRSDIDALKKFVDEVETLLNNADKTRTVVDDLPDSSWDGHLIGRRARYDDTIVIGPDLLESQNLKARAGRLFESDRILIVPRGCKPPLQPKCILLAWDSSVECTRAAHEALDLMLGAEEVHVTIVDADKSSSRVGRDAGAHIAAYLANHGITAILDRLECGGQSVAGVLKQHAREICADLIVIGNHRHSQMFGRVSGGVTASMIDTPRVPVLMVH